MNDEDWKSLPWSNVGSDASAGKLFVRAPNVRYLALFDDCGAEWCIHCSATAHTTHNVPVLTTNFGAPIEDGT